MIKGAYWLGSAWMMGRVSWRWKAQDSIYSDSILHIEYVLKDKHIAWTNIYFAYSFDMIWKLCYKQEIRKVEKASNERIWNVPSKSVFSNSRDTLNKNDTEMLCAWHDITPRRSYNSRRMAIMTCNNVSSLDGQYTYSKILTTFALFEVRIS